MSFSSELTRGMAQHQDLVLVVLLALDSTGHGLAVGSVQDLADMSSGAAIKALESATLLTVTDSGGLELTDSGRAEARLVAARLAGMEATP